MVAAFVSNAEAPGEFCHLGLGERFALLDRLFYSVQDKVLEKFDVVRIDNLLVDLDRDDVARPVCRHFHFAAAGTDFDSLLLELGLCFGHLLLHLLRLLHELVQVHSLRVAARPAVAPYPLSYPAFEHLERFLDERVIFEILRSRML